MFYFKIYDKHIFLLAYDPQEKLRQECINELISTERAYVEDMTIVHNIFEMPLRMSKAISEEEVEIIFVNWQEIIQCNRRFLGDLLDKQDNGNYNIGDAICRHVSIRLIRLCVKDVSQIIFYSYL